MTKAMKNSGIEWIGQIPESWSICKTGKLFRNIKEIVKEKSSITERLALTLNGVIKRSKSDAEGLQPEQFNSYQYLRKNQLVFKLIDLENVNTSRVGLCPFEEGMVSPAYIVLKNNQTDNRFYHYYFLSLWHNEIFNHLGGDGVRSALNVKDLLGIPTFSIDTSEQQAIADYLDEKCGRIDKAIEGQKKIIEKLKEYKQSVITEAVTKGLDPNVPMKDSGIEWIGQIPEHWKLSKVFFFYNIQLGKMLQPIQKTDSDVERKYLCALNVGNNTFKNETNKTMWFSPEELELYSVKNGDLLVVEGGDVASSAFVKNLDEDVCFQNALHRVRPIGKNSLKYLRYLLISAKSSGYIDLICNKATIAHFSKEKFISMPYIVMSFQEQIAISEFLDEKCLKIDEAIQKKEETIEKLTEYKKSLIYECVTGKKEIV